VSVSFDESNLIPNAGLLSPALLAQRIDLPGLFEERLVLAEHGTSSGSQGGSWLRAHK